MLKKALFDCAINEKICSVNGGQLKSVHPREFAIQGKKKLMPEGQPGGGARLGAAGID